MSLYVRVFTNFYSHRKTARLRLVLGNDALWIPPRLWAYAAENQPDGNFEGYKAEEIAMLVGYNGDASSMLQALLDVGFLDDSPLRIHDWQVHNSYHESYAERAKKAAAARWKGKEKDKTGKDRKGKETSIASSMLVASEEIYAEYPRKVDKPSALKAIRKAIAAFTAPFLLERTKAYAAARIGADPQFTPYPATWFNGQRFNDDPSTWKDTAHRPAPQASPATLSPAARAFALAKELDKIEVQLKDLDRQSYEPSGLSADERTKRKELRAKREELRKELNL